MTRPDIRELECFVAVADHLNFSRAAKQLHLSQPPLTRHVQSLEEKLGSKLFERNTHSVSLTDSGQLFLADVRDILGHLDRAGDTIQRARQGETSLLASPLSVPCSMNDWCISFSGFVKRIPTARFR